MRTAWIAIAMLAGGLALSNELALAQSKGQDEASRQFNEIKLSEKQIQNFITAQKQLAPLASKLEAFGDQPDPALQKQVEQIAKNSGFSSVEEFDNVNANISIVLAGLDPQTGRFTQPPDLIKKDMEEIKQDKQISQKDREEALADMQEALKDAKPLQFTENVELVKKHQSELEQVAKQGENKKN